MFLLLKSCTAKKNNVPCYQPDVIMNYADVLWRRNIIPGSVSWLYKPGSKNMNEIKKKNTNIYGVSIILHI